MPWLVNLLLKKTQEEEEGEESTHPKHDAHGPYN